MRTTLTMLSLTLALALAGCLSTIDSGDDTGSGSDVQPPPGGGSGSGGAEATARTYFNANIYPVVKVTCGNAGCHSATSPGVNAPGFVSATDPATDPMAAWTLITGMSNVVGVYATTAPMLSIPQNTAHFAKFTAPQVTSVTSWFSLETAWRAGGNTPIDYLAQWSGCMNIDDFQTAQVAKAYAQQVDTSEGYCKQCHVNGQAQSFFIATPDSLHMFNALTTYREYLSTFFTVSNNAVTINMVPFQLAADGGPNGQHPRNWDPADNNGMDAIGEFFTATQTRLAAGTCNPPTLSD